MKNLYKIGKELFITNDEEIKVGDWVITPTNDIIQWAKVFQPDGKKIILTTDGGLINDGVQAIDDTFLEWFVKNPSYELVEVSELRFFNPDTNDGRDIMFWEQVKQEIEKL